MASGAAETRDALLRELAEHKVEDVEVVAVGCQGYCFAEPLVEVKIPGAPGVKYGYVNEARAHEIVSKHILHGELVDNAIIGREDGYDDGASAARACTCGCGGEHK